RHTRFSRDWSSDVCSSDLGYPDRGWTYRFNLFRMSAASGHVSQQFRPADVFDLVKLCRVLAAELVHDGCLPQSQRKDFAELAAQIGRASRRRIGGGALVQR